MPRRFLAAFSIFAVNVFAFCATANLYAADQFLEAPHFSDPNYQVAMPPDWIAKPITSSDENHKDYVADIRMVLDQQVFRVLQPAINRYASEHKIKISLADGTCGHSAGALLQKKTDIGGFCCPPRNSDRLPGLHFYTMGITAVALLVNPENPVVGVSTRQARELFSGHIERWTALVPATSSNSFNKPVLPVARLHCKTRPGHWRLILGHEDDFSAELKEVGAIPDMIEAVANNEHAIGHAAYWLAVEHYKEFGKVRPLLVNGFSPGNRQALLSGDYPFYKTFSITLWEGEHVANPHAEQLVKYLIAEMENVDPSSGIATPAQLRKAGWKFIKDELIQEGH